MKEVCNKEFLDLRKFDNPINPIELIKSITSNKNIENDPFYIVDLEDICNKHINWITRLPRVKPHYAIKCNTDHMILKLLAYLGAGFDCASKIEIQKILDLGVQPDRIIFANPCKQTSYIKYAYKVGVDYMTFDNEIELKKIKDTHPNAKCVLRIITNDADAVCRFSMKFGADMETSLKLIEKTVELNLNLVGISFHVGSGQMSPKAFSESIENARKLFDYARENFGIKMHLLDLGGGYPGSSDSYDLFNSIAKEINKALDEYFPIELFNQINGNDENKLRVIAEPGRYYACSAFTLCVNVIAKRVMNQSALQQSQDKEANLARIKKEKEKLANSNDEYKLDEHVIPLNENIIDTSKSIMYYINDGVYASFNCLFYDHAECFPILIKEDRPIDSIMYKSSLWGPTCDGLDVISKECFLPELEIGEFLVFKNMGAYTISGAVPFNGIPLAKCIYTASTSWNTIQKAFDKSIEDHMANYLQTDITGTSIVSTCSGAVSLLTQYNSQQQQPQFIDNNDIKSACDSSDEEHLSVFQDKVVIDENSGNSVLTTTPEVITC